MRTTWSEFGYGNWILERRIGEITRREVSRLDRLARRLARQRRRRATLLTPAQQVLIANLSAMR